MYKEDLGKNFSTKKTLQLDDISNKLFQLHACGMPRMTIILIIYELRLFGNK